jgi:hypothetical protein
MRMDPRQFGIRPDPDATSTVAEVAYQEEEGKRLVVAVSGDLSNDGLVSELLTDIVATAPERGAAMRQINAVGEELGWGVEVDRGRSVDVVTLHPAADDTAY